MELTVKIFDDSGIRKMVDAKGRVAVLVSRNEWYSTHPRMPDSSREQALFDPEIVSILCMGLGPEKRDLVNSVVASRYGLSERSLDLGVEWVESGLTFWVDKLEEYNGSTSEAIHLETDENTYTA